MAFFNYVTKEITLKVVYYGPGLSGKTTNLQHLYSILDSSSRGKFISLATESDRTLFFDFLPVELGKIKDFSVRFQLYTVPGQIRYNATRKLVLKGADAVVFVADSQTDMKEQNIESFSNMKENLVANNLNPDDILVVFQFNKRDLPNILSTEELNGDLNKSNYPTIEAVASQGRGVQETFRLITSMLLKDIARKHKVEISPAKEEAITVKVPERERFEFTEEARAEPAQTETTVLRDRADLLAGAEARPHPAPVPPTVQPAVAPVRETGGPQSLIAPFPSRPVPQPEEKMTTVLSMLGTMNESLAGMRELLSAHSRELRDIARQQADSMKVLKELSNAMAQKKKGWWSRLFSR